MVKEIEITLSKRHEVTGVHPEGKKTLNEWILENPQKAIDLANVYLDQRRATVFMSSVGGALHDIPRDKSAQSLSLSLNSYRIILRDARRELSEKLDLRLERKSLNALPYLEKRRKVKNILDKAKSGNRSATRELLIRYSRNVRSMFEDELSQEQLAYIDILTERVSLRISNFEFRTISQLSHWINKVIRNFRIDKQRRINRPNNVKEEKGQKFPVNDLIDLWIRKHPGRTKVLIEALPPRHKTIFEFDQTGKTLEEIKQRINSKSVPSVKATLHKIRIQFAKDAGIHIPKSYRPISYFVSNNDSVQKMIYKKIKAGVIKRVLRFSGRYFITQQIFDTQLSQFKDMRETVQYDLFEQYVKRVYGFFVPLIKDETESQALAEKILIPFTKALNANQNSDLRQINKQLFRACLEEFRNTHQTDAKHESGTLLTEEQRIILAMHLGSGLDYQETAEILGKDLQSVNALAEAAIAIINKSTAA